MQKDILFFKALTPVHCGSGSSLEVIDLPIQREKHTDFPIFQASTVKGCLRSSYKENDVNSIFGPESGNEYASCVSFSDAKILFFPVKSFKGVFVWITCPGVLKRFSQDLEVAGKKENITVPDLADTECVVVVDSKKIALNVGDEEKVVLEEYVLSISKKKVEIDEIVKCPEIKDKLVIVSDNIFSFLVKTATDVVARIRIDSETGVTESGSLWYEENLPAESVLYSIVFTNDTKDETKKDELKSKKVLENLKNKINSVIQIGGNETIGRGLVKLHWLNGGEK